MSIPAAKEEFNVPTDYHEKISVTQDLPEDSEYIIENGNFRFGSSGIEATRRALKETSPKHFLLHLTDMISTWDTTEKPRRLSIWRTTGFIISLSLQSSFTSSRFFWIGCAMVTFVGERYGKEDTDKPISLRCLQA